MQIGRIKIKGFRALLDFPKQGNLHIGPRHAFIGKNDSGKSCILYAVDAFFKNKVTVSDITNLPGSPDFVTIEIGFTNLPDEIELEKPVPTNFKSENLLDKDGYFTLIKKITPGKGKAKSKTETLIKVYDYDKAEYRVLCDKKENDLIDIGTKLGLSLPKSGAGNTNKDRRKKIRDELAKIRETMSEYVEPIKDLYSELKPYLPDFILFPADQSLSEEDTSFQSQFKPIKENLLKQSNITVKTLEENIIAGLTTEFNKIYTYLSRHTKDVAKIKPSPSFDWQKGIKFGLEVEDIQGVTTTLANRGAGIKRLFMVAYFQYLAERDSNSEQNYIFAIEEPEVFLHPSAQRELLESLGQLVDSGNQVLMTTHSPVFAGQVTPEDITLIDKPVNESHSSSLADYNDSKQDFTKAIADELGIEPTDSLALSKAVVFVEGISDIEYFNKFDQVLTNANEFVETLENLGIDFVPTSGIGNIKHWIDMNMVKRLKVKYGVVVDSDRSRATDSLSEQKESCRQVCNADGALFCALRFAEIECYLNPKTIDREEGKTIGIIIPKYCSDGLKPRKIINKALQHAGLNKNIKHYMCKMSAEEIKDACKYTGDDGQECYEIIDILKKLKKLSN